MEKFTKILLVFLGFYSSSFSQKMPLDTSSIGKWPLLLHPNVSSNGDYFSYQSSSKYLYVEATKEHWQIKYQKGNTLTFCETLPKCVFLKSNDTVCVLDLETKKEINFGEVCTYSLFMNNGVEHLALKTLNESNNLIIINLASGSKKTLEHTSVFHISPDGGRIAFIKSEGELQSLLIRDLNTGVDHEIHRADSIWDCFFDLTGKQICIVDADTNTYHIWIWNKKSNKSEYITTIDLEDDQKLSDFKFCKSNKAIFYNKHTSIFQTKPKGRDAIIWTNNSTTSKPELTTTTSSHSINLMRKKDILLTYPNERITPTKADIDDYFLCQTENGDMEEAKWNSQSSQTLILVSTLTGERWQVLESYKRRIRIVSLSPLANHVVYFNPDDRNYYCFDLTAKTTSNLTKNITTNWTKLYADESANSEDFPVGVCGWIDNNNILVNDRFNIWKLDVTNQEQPRNLTLESNKNLQKIFYGLNIPSRDIPIRNGQILLQAFNIKTKEQGFYRMIPSENYSLKELTMDQYLYDDVVNPYYGIDIATSSNFKYKVVKRQSASDYPNYFLTEDFISFSPLTNLQPQKKVNWYSVELVSWNLSDGDSSQGLLYKPENFDPSKKYPVIFYYYDKMSDNRNKCIIPTHSKGSIEIPFLVSNGYLVFTPDIHFRIGKPGMSFLTSVESAANFLSKLPYVDSSRMGLEGHSFGGFGTNYIITHSKRFSAALTASAVNNLVSEYGSTWSEFGTSKINQLETGQYRMGASLWERQDLYLENSPILRCDHIVTPLLIMHNANDVAVSFEQGLSFFNSLRRLNKPVWMLEYPEEGHLIRNESSQKDYEYKCMEFFNYFLKGNYMPAWMNN